MDGFRDKTGNSEAYNKDWEALFIFLFYFIFK